MSSLPRELGSEVIYAAAAVNAWVRGMPLARVALHYRYEPVTALHLIRRCCRQYGDGDVTRWVTANVLSACLASDFRPSPSAASSSRSGGIASHN